MKAMALGPATLLPLFPPGVSAANVYAPKFFSESELELVATLGELIIPQTETPGARASKAHEHIDLVLSEETEEVQRDFRNGLTQVERRSHELHGQRFVALSPQQQTAILTRMAATETPDRG